MFCTISKILANSYIVIGIIISLVWKYDLLVQLDTSILIFWGQTTILKMTFSLVLYTYIFNKYTNFGLNAVVLPYSDGQID